MLAGKRLLITGVLTRKSIAYAVAEEALRHGAQIALTGFGRSRSITERAARGLGERPPPVFELDVGRPEDFERLRETLAEHWGGLDGVVHAIAGAPREALGGGFLHAPTASALEAFAVSAVSLRDLCVALLPLMDRGASIVGLDFDASVAWPVYDWMGVAKAGLESIARYLARDLGARGIRVNLVASGPLRSVSAAAALGGFELLSSAWSAVAPLGWDSSDARPVAGGVCFMLSDWSAGVTGEILHVDGGYGALGAPGQLPQELFAAGRQAT